MSIPAAPLILLGGEFSLWDKLLPTVGRRIWFQAEVKLLYIYFNPIFFSHDERVEPLIHINECLGERETPAENAFIIIHSLNSIYLMKYSNTFQNKM